MNRIYPFANFKNDLLAINPGTKSLIFLADRINDVNYRGMQISQHNRYDVDIVIKILENIDNLVGSNLMQIRDTDLSKRKYNIAGEEKYAELVNIVNSQIGRCTQDSLRKNLFVDFHRMDLIDRYDDNKNILDPWKRASHVKYISLTQRAKDLIKVKNNTFDKNFQFTNCINILTHDLANELFDVIISAKNKGCYVDKKEFMFFISAMNEYINDNYYSKSELIDYMIEYRGMSLSQKDAVDRYIQEYCNPSSFLGNKNDKRDYHNWKNETDQIFMLMEQTFIFEIFSDRLQQKGISSVECIKKRSVAAKTNYFINHKGITKQIGYELHHIIPLCMAKNIKERNMLDVWQNLIYIDAYTHSKITHSNNKNFNLYFNNDDIILKDFAQLLPDIDCQYLKNVLYKLSNKSIMKSYNDKTINSL